MSSALLETLGNVVGNVAIRRKWVGAGVLVIVVSSVERVFGTLGPVKPDHPQVAVTRTGS